MDDQILGLDIGTSTCEVAFYSQSEGVRPPLPIGQDGVTTFRPSTAFVDPDRGLLVGEEAANAARSGRSGILLPSAKRYVIHRRGDGDRPRPPWPAGAPGADRVIECLVCEALNRTRLLLHQSGACTPEQFRSIPLHLSCPTDADKRWREKLVMFAREHGMAAVSAASVVEEATGAALGHAAMMGLDPGEHLVYDYGGGTFDAAWIRIDRQQGGGPALSVVASQGQPNLGGDDVDLQLYCLLARRAAQSLGVTEAQMLEYLEGQEPVAGQRLREEARRAKHDLSQIESAFLSLDVVLDAAADEASASGEHLARIIRERSKGSALCRTS